MGQRRPGSAALATIRAIRLVAHASPRTFATAVVLQLVGALAAVALVYAAKLTVEAVVGAEERLTAAELTVAVSLLAFATALSNVAGTLQSQQQRLLAEDVSTRTWRDLLAVLGRVDMTRLDSPTFAERADRLQANALNRPLAIATASLGLLGSIVTVAVLSGAVLAVEPLLVPVLLLAGLPSVYLSRRAGDTELAFTRRWSDAYRRRHYYRRLLSDQEFAKEVRSFQLQPEVERRHVALSADYRSGLRSQVRRRQAYGLAGALFTGVVLAAALAVIVWLVDSGRMGLADAAAAVVAVRLLSGALSRVFSSVGSILESSLFLRELHQFLEESAVPGADPPVALPLRSGIALRGCWFRYPEADHDVLEDVDLDLGAGEVVALVGENGSGKSTLAKIVSGLYAPTSGEVLWDGRVVDPSSRESVRRSVSVIFQDFVRYDLSAADNIQISQDHDAEQLWSAARAARVDGVLAALPQGIETVLGRQFEGAVDLSGGQWQRIALARALVRQTSVLVLDEPSSALDPRTEHELFADLRAVAGHRAVLLISHRYANLHLADRIVVLQEGRVVDQGTHGELVSRQGLYAQLYGMQAQSYGVT